MQAFLFMAITLAWHSQQPNKYLKRLIADKELPPSSNVTRCLVIKNKRLVVIGMLNYISLLSYLKGKSMSLK